MNFNSILLSFQKYETVGYTYHFTWNGFNNYIAVVKDLFANEQMLTMLKNSGLAYVCGLFITTPLALVFSYYVMRKFTGHGFFRVILFMPTIICSIITLFIFKNLCDNIIPEIIGKLFYANDENFVKDDFMFLVRMDTRFTAILVFSIFTGFGVNVLMYTGAMSGVDDSLFEAVRLDGATDFQEFLHIVIPCVYPTLTTFIVVGVASFFTNQLALFDLYGYQADASIWTLGYYMYTSSTNNQAGVIKEMSYPYLSALGITFTIIATPITLGVKYLLEKLGPSEE